MEEVTAMQGSLDEAFEKFEKSCDSYRAALESEDDLYEAMAYFHVAQVKYLCMKDRCAMRIESIQGPAPQTRSEDIPGKNVELQITPNDSASQVESKRSLFSRFSRSSKGTHSRSSLGERVLKNAARKASLLAEASMLQQKQLLENQELQVNQIKEEFYLRTNLAKIDAMEKVFD